jgi:hypothetical protein
MPIIRARQNVSSRNKNDHSTGKEYINNGKHNRNHISEVNTKLTKRRRRLHRLHTTKGIRQYFGLFKYGWIFLVLITGWLVGFYIVVVEPSYLKQKPQNYREQLLMTEEGANPPRKNKNSFQFYKSKDEIEKEKALKVELAKFHPKPEPRYQPHRAGHKFNLRLAFNNLKGTGGGEELIDMRDLNRKMSFEVPEGGKSCQLSLSCLCIRFPLSDSILSREF